MLVPAALEQWAAEHNDQLSDETIAEVQSIAAAIAASPVGDQPVGSTTAEFEAELDALFPGARRERVAAVLPIVAEWAAKRSKAAAAPDAGVERDDQRPAATPIDPESAESGEEDQPSGTADAGDEPAEDVPPQPPTAVVTPPAPAEISAEPGAAGTHQPQRPSTGDPQTPPGPRFAAPATTLYPAPDPADRVAAPAFLHSDKVDEEDDVRLYGPKWPWKALLGTVVALALLGGVAVAGWWWFTQRDDTTETATADPVTVTPEPVDASDEPLPEASAAPTAEPTPLPATTPVAPSFWADTTPILNSGTSQISASTYAVSPANRAVLTGHTAAITGVVVSDEGRVLTSGADRRLVDWGADVTLANPDVLNVPAPLTVLERTADQRILAGDSDGNLTIIDLVDTTEPVVITVFDVAISAATELSDGRLAVASADGDLVAFAVDTPDERATMSHPGEVTAVVALSNGLLASTSIDGVVRIWEPTAGEVIDEIAVFDGPATALALLADGRVAVASIDGSLVVVTPDSTATNVVVLPGHTGAIRSLFEITLADGSRALASGGDDTTVRLWDLETQTEITVLEGHGDIISGLDALPDGRLVSTSGDGTGRVWDLSVPASRPVIPPHDWNLSALHPWRNDQFVTGGTDGKVVLASTSEQSTPLVITTHDAPIVGLSVLQSGDIVSLDAGSILRINQPDGQPAGLVELELTPGATALSVREGLGVVTGHADGSVRFHDFVEEVAGIEAHGSGVNDVVALTNGLVVSAGQDMTVRILDFDNPDQVPVFDLHTAPVDVVIELPDGRIASAGSDGIYVFDLDGLGSDAIRLNGQRARTISLVALPGDRLISTGDDGRIRLWDLNQPESEPITLIDIPGVINPHLIQAENGLFVAGAARGYVVFTPS